MRINLCIVYLICVLLLLSCQTNFDGAKTKKISDDSFPIPQIDFSPKNYICYMTSGTINIDGKLDKRCWSLAPWTDCFIDIEGNNKSKPRFKTRAKMLWDSSCFYIAAEMEEPHVWGKLQKRDAVIYHDNDFEVFIDPDGDTHEYYELEVNALNTQWDLLINKPYRDGGPAINAWDIQGLKTAVYIDGTINNPGDIDRGWSIEIAIPWNVLKQCAHRPAPPKNGDIWRVNFSRVEWQTFIDDGQYIKQTDSAIGKILPEDNWVWSPQGLIAMHYPEMWGYVQFSNTVVGDGEDVFIDPKNASARWFLRKLYYAEQTHRMQYGHFTIDLSSLNLDVTAIEGYIWPPDVSISETQFEVILKSSGQNSNLHITQDGRIWSSEN
ncbi:MAG: carbohydrate-binding family 9-like protein [candidate division Zixibacteria bacterium]